MGVTLTKNLSVQARKSGPKTFLEKHSSLLQEGAYMYPEGPYVDDDNPSDLAGAS